MVRLPHCDKKYYFEKSVTRDTNYSMINDDFRRNTLWSSLCFEWFLRLTKGLVFLETLEMV